MEYSSAVDLDSLLQSQGEIDSDEEHSSVSIRHHRTVDEILLNHSSSSPSPPSSPSNSQFLPLKDDDGDYGSTSFSYQRLSHSQSSSFVESGKYNSAASFGSNSNRTKYGGRVLPQLFANGAIRSNAKPGAALAAAAAASRSIPTPHATAIKLRRATTADVLQRSISETSEKVASDASSPSAVISRVSEDDSDAEIYLKPLSQDEDVMLGNTNPDSTQTDGEGGHMEKSESERDLPSDDTNVTGQVLSALLDEKSEEYLEACAADESGGPTRTLNVLLHTEDVAGGVEAIDLGDAVGEPGSGDCTSMRGEVAETEDLVSLQESEEECSNLLQKPDSSLKQLDLAEEIERKQASTRLHYEEGAAAQPMRLEGVQRGSTVLGYFDVNSNNAITQTISSQAFRRDHGCAQVVAVHFNYIAVGTSKGSIFVVPSKYTAHLVDNMDTQMISLGLQGDRSHIPVTSMCFNQQGELLFAGYGDGHYTVWDVQKAKALKVVTEHRAPVVHMLYMGQDTQVTRQFNVVSGDSKGVVKLISFSVVPWVNMISYTKPMKLLDETTSRVICASPLLYGEGHGGTIITSQSNSAVSTSSVSSMMGGMVDGGVVIFITHQSALVAKVIPTVDVYAQIPKPDGIREGAMPYAAWRCMSQSLGSSSENALVETSDKVSLLAIAWDREIRVAQLLKSKLKVLEKWTLESEAIGLAWLGEEMLVILTTTAQLCLFTKDGNLIHQTSFSDGFRTDDLISHHIYFSNSLGNPEKAHHNSVAVRGATIYILGQEHLIVSRLLSWKERIEVLRKAGDWMGALNMAMALYDGQSHGVVDLPKNLADIQMIVMPYLVELLLAYVGEVFSYISVACDNQNDNLDQSNEIKEQYIRVGGVAVEFCVHVKRTDILFDDILSKFDEAHQKETFLELLEPYILKDMLGSLPPEIMQALVEHYSKRGWLQRIEQCVLHMDILSLDFNQVVRLCREHRLHCALIYLFNKGLDDYKTPLEELLLVLRESSRENATSLGYRMLVYLKYCFQGLAFPPGRGNLSPMRLPSLRKELLHFLLEDSSAPNSWAATSLPSDGSYANVIHLLQLDTEATLAVLGCAFIDIGLPKLTDSSQESNNFNMESAESENLIQRMVDVLADILDTCYLKIGSSLCSADVDLVEVWPSIKDVEHMLDFIANYAAYEQANVSRDIVSHILEYLTSDVNASDTTSGKTIEIFKRREKQLLSLIQVVPETHWDAPYVLHLSAKAQFHQISGYIHAISQQYNAAMDSYMKETQEPIYAFSFIYDMLRLLSNEESDAFKSAVISRIPDLLKLSREGTYFLIVDHFSEKTQHILSELQSYPESLFLYLKTVVEVHVTGTLNISCLKKIDFPKARRAQLQSNGVQAYLEEISISQKLLPNNQVNVTDEMMELYFELLCRYDHKSVLKFLETSESYRVEHCLRLCQKYGIIDAASFLLERVGEVGSALHLILSNLGDKLMLLDAEIQKASCHTIMDNLDAVLKKKVVSEILDIIHACIGLCQRNSPRLQPEESEYLWFQLLDSFCEPLMDLGNARTGREREAIKDTLDESIGQSDEGKGHKMKWEASKSRKGARMIRKLFSIFIKEIVEGMIGFVRLPRIMMKLLSDNGNQEFGDFKPTILGMLGTYDFERKILDTARSLIEDDTYYTMSLLRKGASHGYAPRSLVCCICNSFLSKYSTDSSIQVFSCGHAMHLHCQLEENRGSSRGTLVGCPICIPRKKAQKSSGKSSMFSENGLVSSSPSLMQQAHGSSPLHPHIHETPDNSFGLNLPSRFELLHNLEKDERWAHIENTPQLRLAPPALYHEKVKKGIHVIAEESSSSRVFTRHEKPRSRQLKDVKVKRSSARFPLKSNIFGKVQQISRR